MPGTILRLLLLLGCSYLLICALVYVAQERLIFFPERDPPGTRYSFGIPLEEVWLPVDDATLHALWFRVAEPQGIILYFHGNAGSLRSWGGVAPDLVTYGYDLLIVDYRGYGQSSGQIRNEAQLYADAAAAYAWVRERYPEEQIVLYGRSLGSAPAARLAAEGQPRMLILESPFYSLEALARRQFPWAPPFLLKYPLHTHRWAPQVRCPVLIVHGAADPIAPIADAERLAATIGAPLRFVAIPGGGHNDLAAFPTYHTALAAALRTAD
jgi:uncharacterized protein